MPDPNEADVIAMSQHPLHAVWCAGGDASNSPDFRNEEGELDEEAYVRYGLNVMRRAYAEVAAAVWAEAVAALRDPEALRPFIAAYREAERASGRRPAPARVALADCLESLSPKGDDRV